MADINAAVQKVNDTVQVCIKEVQAVRAKIETGEVRAADLDSKMEKMAADVNKQDAEIASIRAAMTAQPVIVPGDVKRFVGADGAPRMLDAVVERRLAGSTRPVVSRKAGWLSSPDSLSDAHVEAKACWEYAVMLAVADGALRMDPEGRVSRGALMQGVSNAAPGMLDRIAVLAEADGLGSADTIRQRVFGVESGSGSDLIPSEVLLPDVARIGGANQTGGLASLFDQKNLTAKNTYINIRSALPRLFNKGLANATTAAEIIRSNSTTSKALMDPKPFACGVDVDRDADTDAIISMMMEVRTDIALSMMLGLDDAIINGDMLTATHIDDTSGALASWNPEGVFSSVGAGGALDHRRMFSGLRYKALTIGSNATLDLGGALTYTKIGEMHAKFTGGRGLNPSRVAVITDFLTIIKHISSLTEVVTLEKFGPQATILTGQVVSLGGRPVIRTPFMGRSGSNSGSFNAAGKFATSSVTKQAILLADLGAHTVGTRKGVTLESATQIVNDTTTLIATSRHAFMSPDHGAAAPTSSSIVNVAYGFNL